MNRVIPLVGKILLLSVICYAAARLGMLLAIARGNVSPVWPSTGLSIAILLLWGPRAAPGVFLGTFGATLETGVGMVPSVGAGFANMAEALFAVTALRRLHDFPERLASVRIVFSYIVCAGVIGPLLSATVGTSAMTVGGVVPAENFGTVWYTWWLGNVTGALVVGPPILAWLGSTVDWNRRFALEWMEFAVIAALVGLVGILGFAQMPEIAGLGARNPLEFIFIPLVVWAAYRFGHPGSTLVVLIAAAAAIWHTARGLGPFAITATNESLLLLQTYIACLAVSGLTLAGAVAERSRAEQDVRELAAELENRVETRTAQLKETNEELSREVQQRKSAEKQLVAGRETFTRIVEKSSDGVLVVNEEGAVLFASPSAERVFTQSQESIVGTHFGLPTVDAAVTELDVPRRNGESGVVEMRVEETDWYDRPAQIIMLRDVTEMRAAEQALLAARDELEDRVRERTEELVRINDLLRTEISDRIKAEEKARELNKELERRVRIRTEELERINARLKDLIHVISHDMKAPLRGLNQIVGWMHEDHAEEVSSDLAKKIEMLSSQVKRMHGLIEAILQVARIERVRTREIEVDVNAVVTEAIQMVSPPEDVTVEVPHPLPTVKCQRPHLQTLFQNLIDNGVKFLDKPNGIVRITCEDAGNEWIFSVADNGPGINPSYRDKIFDLFKSGGGRKSAGSGVGLAIVKRTLDTNNGRIWVEDAPGGGSVFRFTWGKSETVSDDEEEHEEV